MNKFVKLLCVFCTILLLPACSNKALHTSSRPPRAMYIDTESELFEVLNFAETKGEFLDFQKRTNDTIVYASIEENDIYTFSDLISKVGLPALPKDIVSEAFTLEYRPDYDQYSAIYRVNGVRYRFFVEPFENYTKRIAQEVAICEIDGTELAFYKGDGNTLVGEIYSNGYQIRVIVMDLEDPDDLIFPPFFWTIPLTK